MAMAKRKVRLGILFGGKSGEHEVSLSSAASVIAALNPEEFEVFAIGITRTGRLADAAELRNMLPQDVSDHVRFFSSGTANAAHCFAPGLHLERRDSEDYPEIVFPLLHGPYGEDGTIQGLLEIAGIPYIGCGVLASAVGMDKDVMKRLFAEASLPIVPFRVEWVRGLEDRVESLRHEVEAQFGYPIFCKPANLGSSVGVHKIHHAGEFCDALLSSARFDRKIIIEKGIDARELECAILGNDEPEASGVGEVLSGNEFYDYEAKYVNPRSRVQIPAEISKSTAEQVRDLARSAFKVIDGSGLARVDFFLDRKTDTVWLNEINTMPGFTSISMYPKLWAARGMTFNHLISRLVDFGFERFRARSSQACLHSRTPAAIEMASTPNKRGEIR
jgi:D-alanine-D-alanine ligase